MSPITSDDRNLQLAVDTIEKQFGTGAIMRLGAQPRLGASNSIPPGSLALAIALGIGGTPRGRIIEIDGPEAGGKTTLALHIMSQAQQAGGRVAIIDAEHAMDPEYAAKIGLDINEL